MSDQETRYKPVCDLGSRVLIQPAILWDRQVMEPPKTPLPFHPMAFALAVPPVPIEGWVVPWIDREETLPSTTLPYIVVWYAMIQRPVVLEWQRTRIVQSQEYTFAWCTIDEWQSEPEWRYWLPPVQGPEDAG